MDYIKNEDSGIEKYREIRPFRCPVCNSRVCDVRRWSRKDKARFSFLHSDGLDGGHFITLSQMQTPYVDVDYIDKSNITI